MILFEITISDLGFFRFIFDSFYYPESSHIQVRSKRSYSHSAHLPRSAFHHGFTSIPTPTQSRSSNSLA